MIPDFRGPSVGRLPGGSSSAPPVSAAAAPGRIRDVCAAIAFLFADGIDEEIFDAIADPDPDLVELIDHLVELRREVNRS